MSRVPSESTRRWLPRAAASVAALATIAAAFGAAAPASAATTIAVPTPSTPSASHPGFGAAFFSPYFFNGGNEAAQATTALAAQKAAGDNTVIIEWAADYDADDAAYPASSATGYSEWNDAVPQIVAAAQKEHMTVWMGLVVAPDSFTNASDFTNQSFLNSFTTKTETVASDLYSKYKSSIAGWYIPTEPAQANVSTSARAEQFGKYLGGISTYLHTHLGDKPVMVSPSMPTATLSGLSATTFVSEMQPMLEYAKVDVVDLQDGYEMTAWTPSQEVTAFKDAKTITNRYGMQLWADVYTPVSDGNGLVPVSKMEPYLSALAGTGAPLTEWEFASYMDPDTSKTNGSTMAANYKAYMAYLGLKS